MTKATASTPRVCLLALALGALAPAAPAAPPDATSPHTPMLAERWRDELDPAAYLVSEKLDGVRAHWDGAALRLRGGRAIAVPSWFLAGLPASPLDGELWLGRGRFDELSGLVRRQQADDAAWRAVRYMVFDLPGDLAPFRERAARLAELVEAAGLPRLRAVPQFTVANRAELAATLAAVLAGGGEGLMLHRADAPWRPGRSDALLKLTPWLDAEATVVGYVPGKGRYRGLLGALELEAPDGRRFRVGTGLSEAERRAPPPLGSEVTYRYRQLGSGGLPRFPVYMRQRLLP